MRSVIAALLLCATQVSTATLGEIVVTAPRYALRLTSIASYYTLEGRTQADGQPHRGRRLTAAHRTAAFGDTLIVTRIDTGKSVRVVVTDRLGKDDPADRIVDLSKKAARQLGMLHIGIAKVTVKRLPRTN